LINGFKYSREYIQLLTGQHWLLSLNLPLRAGLHVSDRNRADLDWKNGMFTWDIETNLPSIGLFRSIPTPDPGRRWRRVLRKPARQMEYSALYLCSLFPVGKHIQFNAYYE